MGLAGPAASASSQQKLQVSSGGGADALSLKYFSQLSDDEVANLYRAYRFEFLAFGYDVGPYLEGRAGMADL